MAQSSSWEALNESGVKAYEQGRYTEAEKQLKAAIRAAQISKSQDQHLASSLNNLAALYHAQDKYNKAEQLYRKSLSIAEKSLGGEHPFVVKVLTNLADLYSATGRDVAAARLYQRLLGIQEKTLGSEHPNVVMTLNNLAGRYYNLGDYNKAEPLYQRALAIQEKALGPEHSDLATTLNNLAALYEARGNYDQAEPLYRRAVGIADKALGPDHPNLLGTLTNYGTLLRKMNREKEASELEARVKATRARYAEKFKLARSQAVYVLAREGLSARERGGFNVDIIRINVKKEFLYQQVFRVVDSIAEADFVFLLITYVPERTRSPFEYEDLAMAVTRTDYLKDRSRPEVLRRKALWVETSQAGIGSPVKSKSLVRKFHFDMFGHFEK